MSRPAQPPAPLSVAWSAMSAAAGLALVGLGVAAAVAPATAARLFGVPVTGDAGLAYVTAAGVRDLAAGGLTVAFALRRDRRAVGLTVLVGTLIPVGDGLVALRHSPAPWRCVPLHWGSALACLAFAGLLLRRRATAAAAPHMQS